MTATSRASPANRADRVDRGDGQGDGGTDDRGMVTVEAAVALCAFVTVLAMVLAGMSMVLAQIRCTDAAAEAARLVARGEANRAGDAVSQLAPHAVLSVTTQGDAIHVTVQDPEANGLLPGVHVAAEAFAVQEPDAGDSEPEPPGDPGPPVVSGPPQGGPPQDGAPDRASSRPTGGDGR